jgi:hypothetical protein
MAHTPLHRVTNLVDRSRRAVGNLVDKVKQRQEQTGIRPRVSSALGPVSAFIDRQQRQNLKIGTNQLRVGAKNVAEFGEKLSRPVERLENPFTSIIRQSIGRPLSVGGRSIEGLSEGALQLTSPKKTLESRKPTTLEDPFGTFEEPTNLRIATNILGAGFDVTDVARFGLVGLVAGGTKNEGFQVINDIQDGFKAGRKAKNLSKNVTNFERARTQILDRLSPVFDLVEKGGKELPATTNPYKRFRLLAGLGGEAKDLIDNEFVPIIRPLTEHSPEALDDLSTLLVLQRSQELAERGLKTKHSQKQIQASLDIFVKKYGKDFGILGETAQKVRNYGDSLLEMLRKSGVVDQKSFDAIKAKNQLYVPFRVVDFISENVEKGRFSKASFNIASQDVIKGIKGTEKQIGDPLEALVERTGKVIALARKNEALQVFTNLRKEGDVFKDLIKPAGKTIEKGFDTINLFENGKNVAYEVPEAIADAIKNVDKQSSNIISEVLKPQAKLLRLGATGLNLGFIPVNWIRDAQDAIFSTFVEGARIGGFKTGIKETTQLLFSYPAAISSALKNDDLYRQWLKSGAAQSTFTSQLIGKSTETIQGLKTNKSIFRKILSSPKNGLEFMNKVAEESTRLARFKRGIDRGEDVLEAAFQSRDITIDFAKSGNSMKTLNAVIPFLNAGVQGTEKMLRIFKNNPKEAIIGATMLASTPALMLHLHNRELEDYKDIPQFEKDTNWIILARDRTQAEKLNGEPLVGIKIPKPFFIRPIANTTGAFLDYVDQTNPQTLTEFLANTLEEVSPVGIPFTGRFFSGVTPPLFQAGLESVTNKNLFTGFPIVPRSLEGVEPGEQFKETTPNIYVKLGRALNVSPLKIENAVRTTTGGVGRQIGNLLSGNLKEGTVGEISRRFVGIRGGVEMDKEFDRVDKFKTKSSTESLKEKRQAEKIFEFLQKEAKTNPKQVSQDLALIEKAKPELYEKILDIANKTKTGETSLDRYIKTLPVKDGSRARYIIERLNELEGNEQEALLTEFIKKKIISDSVQKDLVLARKAGLLKIKPKKQSTAPSREKIASSGLKVNLPNIPNPFKVKEAFASHDGDVEPVERKDGFGDTIKKSVGKFLKGINFFNPKDVVAPDIERTGPGFTEPMQQPLGKTLGVSSDKESTKKIPATPYNNAVEKVFGENYKDALRVLRWEDEDGTVRGENTNYQTGPEVDIKNKNGSIDRGLYRINSNTFADFMRRKGNLLRKNGINSYEDMYDPVLNIKMAKIIYDEQGWKAWFAAPPDLRK